MVFLGELQWQLQFELLHKVRVCVVVRDCAADIAGEDGLSRASEKPLKQINHA